MHPLLKNNSEAIEDLQERIDLRNRLKCKSFKWYLENIYPEKFIPDENVLAYGRVKVQNRNLCLDNLQREDDDKTYNLGMYGCHPKLYPSQVHQFQLCTKIFFPMLLSLIQILSFNEVFLSE